METTNLSVSMPLIATIGYPLIFIAMIFEGPLTTMAAAFAASLGFLDISVIFALSYLGDLITDIFYYSLGYWGGNPVVAKLSRRLGIKNEKVEKVQNYLKEHAFRGLLIIKLIPFAPNLGLATAGAIRLPLKRFLKIVMPIILGTSIFYNSVGFFFGKAYEKIAGAINNVGLSVLILIIISAAIYWSYKLTKRKVAEKMGQKNEDSNLL